MGICGLKTLCVLSILKVNRYSGMKTIRKNFLIALALMLVTTSASLFLSYSEFPFNTHAPSLAGDAAHIAPFK
jgi:hypothetical protein